MNLIYISKEHNFFHISDDCDHIDYSFYDSNGRILDGGQYDEIVENKSLEESAKELIEVFKLIDFTEPYIKLEGLQADNFIEIIEEQDYENTQNRVLNYLKDINDLEIEK